MTDVNGEHKSHDAQDKIDVNIKEEPDETDAEEPYIDMGEFLELKTDVKNETLNDEKHNRSTFYAPTGLSLPLRKPPEAPSLSISIHQTSVSPPATKRETESPICFDQSASVGSLEVRRLPLAGGTRAKRKDRTIKMASKSSRRHVEGESSVTPSAIKREADTSDDLGVGSDSPHFMDISGWTATGGFEQRYSASIPRQTGMNDPLNKGGAGPSSPKALQKSDLADYDSHQPQDIHAIANINFNKHYLVMPESVSCLICKAPFSYRQDLFDHGMSCHSTDTLSFCSFCNSTFECPRSFKKHLKTHMLSCQCPICYKSFKSSKNFKRHVLTHSGIKGYKCEVCAKSFTVASTLMRHMTIHTKDWDYRCPQCDKGFAHANSLKNHMTSHIEKKRLYCEPCDRTFARTDFFNVHMASHDGHPRFACTICNREFNHKGHLNHHMMVHANARPHRCGTCNKTFRQTCHLKEHIKIHAGIKPFGCTMCSKAFTEKGQLLCHMKTHKNCKPYKCKKCGEAFKQPRDLKRHSSTHSSERVYLCKICNKRFYNSSSLNRHTLIHVRNAKIKAQLEDSWQGAKMDERSEGAPEQAIE